MSKRVRQWLDRRAFARLIRSFDRSVSEAVFEEIVDTVSFDAPDPQGRRREGEVKFYGTDGLLTLDPMAELLVDTNRVVRREYVTEANRVASGSDQFKPMTEGPIDNRLSSEMRLLYGDG